ncbi:MAG: serine/threonine protein kinase [Planctomycetes bacterium]|nr:serine/threonine protein kinase [Planctomycetota bacterium]
MDDRSASRDPAPTLRDLVAACLERMDVDGDAALDAFCSAHPEHADEIRRRVQKLDRIGILGETSGALPSGSRLNHAAADLDIPVEFDDYRLREPIGAGGMGVVYVAEQRSLHRDVAIKFVRPDHVLVRSARQRFDLEVDAVAKLDHPGIVKILARGEVRGLPYYVMELLDGIDLGRVIDHVRKAPAQKRTKAALEAFADQEPDARLEELLRGPWHDAAFRIVLQVASALQHAHERGILHRDVKPTNILLCRDGRVVLLDFGLARHDESHGLTRSGANLGSIPYMAPEQFSDSVGSVTARTDVYGLGVTLYELLTLRRAFPERSTTSTKAQLVNPTAPSRIDAKIPWDAESVCLCAMDEDPARRYSAAGAMADDLRRFLARQPILAIRPHAALRMRRWAERHPARATAIVAMLAAGMLVAAGYAFLENRRVRDLRAALTETRAANERARENLDGFLSAINSAAVVLSDDKLDALSGVASLRKRALERIASTCEQGLQHEDDARLHAMLLKTRMLLYDVDLRLGNLDEAEHAIRAATDAAERLVAAHPDDREMRHSLALALHRVGNLEITKRNGRAYFEPWRRSVEVCEGLTRDDPDEPLYRTTLLRVARRLAKAYAYVRDDDATNHYLKLADESLAALVAHQDDEASTWLEAAYLDSHRGDIADLRGDLDGATTAYESCVLHLDRAQAIVDRTRTGSNEIPLIAHEIRGLAERQLATFALSRNDGDAAARHGRAAVAIFANLVALHPEQTQLRRRLASVRTRLGSVEGALSTDERRTMLRDALATWTSLIEESGDGISAREGRANTLSTLAELELGARTIEAKTLRRDLDLAIEDRRVVLPTRGPHRVDRFNLASTLGIAARLELTLGTDGDRTRARTFLDESQKLLDENLAASPESRMDQDLARELSRVRAELVSSGDGR